MKKNKSSLPLPNWVPILYGIACGVLIPWTIFLAYLLPKVYISHNWDLAWIGFDIFEIVLFGLSLILIIKKSVWVSLSSLALSVIVFIDAWFDVLTSRPGQARIRSILDALIIELPIAIISFIVSINIFRYINSRPSK